MKRYLIVLGFALSLTACGSASPLGSIAPSAVPGNPQAAATSSGKLGTSYVQGPNSCPDSDFPKVLKALVGSGQSVRLQWSDVGSIHVYLVESEYYPASNVYQLELSTATEDNFVKFLPTGGRHRFRVRTQNDCGALGPWSDYEYYSTDFDNDTPPAIPPPSIIIPPGETVPPVVDPPPPVPPVPPVVCEFGDHNNDGHCDSGDNGNPPDNPGNGGDNGNGGGNGGGTPPPVPPVSPSCDAGFHASPVLGSHPPVFECVPDGDPHTGDSQSGNGGHGHAH
jgi:hypothetical protein